MNTDERTVRTNEVLAAFYPGWSIYRKAGRLRVIGETGRDIPAILGGNGDWLAHYHNMGTGHTGAVAVGQLIRWIRDLPRLPVATWKYWVGNEVRLTTLEAIRLLEDSDYGDPDKTCCVLCGSARIGDWWCGRDSRLVGPCCGMRSGCWQRPPGPNTYSRLPRPGKRKGG